MEELVRDWNDLALANTQSPLANVDVRLPVKVALGPDNKPPSNQRRILVIAGSDSSGGAYVFN